MNERVGFWIGLPIGPGHVTIVIRHNCEPAEQEHFKRILREEIAPLLPIQLKILRGLVLKGYNNDVPTLSVQINDVITKEDALKSIYARNYQQVPEHTAYPTLDMHMTIKDPDVNTFASYLINQQDGHYMATTATLKQVGNPEVIDHVDQYTKYGVQ